MSRDDSNEGSDFDPINNLLKFSGHKLDENKDLIFPSEYFEPEPSPAFERKLEKLNGLTEVIEKEGSIFDIDKSIFQGYKVSYLEKLNDRQLAAAGYLDGTLLVIAGAGTGKTRTIVYRVSYMIEKGISPQKILLLTFTKKAANEMLDRVRELIKDNKTPDNIKGGTFHSFSNYLLRKYSGVLDINPGFSVLDREDSEDVIDLLRSEYGYNKNMERPFPKKKTIYEIISKANNLNITVKEVVDQYFPAYKKFLKEINTLHEAYEKYKNHYFLLDFDDLLTKLAKFLRENEIFLSKVREEVDYILVDEYQDTNVVQREIVNLIGAKKENIMVVGDDFQSIYGFRGANWENILEFPEDYPSCKVVKLEENYRSTQEILDFINCIVDSVRVGYKKKLFTKGEKGQKPVWKKFYSQEDEAHYIVEKILKLREEGVSLDDIAVAYRASFHANFVQAELLRRNIPYVVYGGVRFIERRHVKDVISYLRILANPYDAVSWHRILKLIPKIGDVRASSIIEEIYGSGGRINFESFKNQSFYSYLNELKDVLIAAGDKEVDVAEKVRIINEYYYEFLKKLEADYSERKKDLEVILELAKRYEELERFLSDLSLEPPSKKFQDKTTPLVKEKEEKGVVLTTVHSAKGLEWNSVFVIHLLDGLFPSARSLKDIMALEEERRLFYVAASRACRNLYLTFPHQVVMYDGLFTHPSRFLKDVWELGGNYFEESN